MNKFKIFCFFPPKYPSPVLLRVPAVSSRLRLHEGKVIKDRRHHLRTYPNCFVGRELIDWLLDHKEASDRHTAVRIMQRLLDQSIIHHGEALHVHSDNTAQTLL